MSSSELNAVFSRSEISFSKTYNPTPSILDGVLLKYLSTNFFLSPSASKICEPLYEWSVEIPILFITFKIPLAIALL